jgi:tRNA pseudouridine13 synthase
MSELPYAHGGPPLQGVMRAQAEDFQVDEVLGFAADGSGEHALLTVEKRGANTVWVAQQIARFACVPPMAVGFSGLKDRHALTRQAFSVHLAGRKDPDWSAMPVQGVSVLAAARNSRKLKRGVHRANQFRIRLRDVCGDRAAAEHRLRQLRELGAPNYFGIQRFGHGADNLRAARELFAGKRMGRSQRGFALSAARSALFNAVLARRVVDQTWNEALPGEVFMLAGTHSIFGPQTLDAQLLERLQQHDIDPTGPMWGAGELRTRDLVAELERDAVLHDEDLAAGLAAAELRQERRSLRMMPVDLDAVWQDTDCLELRFTLPSGCFATSLIREMGRFRES